PVSLPSLSRLQAFLQTLLNSEGAPDAEDIAHFVQDGGLHYEAKLAQIVQGQAPISNAIRTQDLKGLLLQVEHDLAGQPAPVRDSGVVVPTAASGVQLPRSPEAAGAYANLMDHLTSHLGHLETQQAINLLAQLHGTPYQLQIPLYTGQA